MVLVLDEMLYILTPHFILDIYINIRYKMWCKDVLIDIKVLFFLESNRVKMSICAVFHIL